MCQPSLFSHWIYEFFILLYKKENSSMFLFNHICKKKKNNLGYAKFSSGLHKNKKNAMLPTPESSWNSEYDQKLKANIFKMHNILLIV